MSIFLINPYILAPFVPPTFIEREFFASGYNAARVTTTSTAYSSVTSLSTTETSGSYIAFWQGTLDNSSATTDARAQLFETSARQLTNIEPQDTTDAFSVGGAYPYTGGTNKTFQIQYSTESGTTGIAGRALNVLKLSANDKWAYNSGSTTGTASPGTAAATITVTAAGEYVIIASAMVDPAGSASVRVPNDPILNKQTRGLLTQAFNQDASNWTPYFYVGKIDVPEGETWTVSINAVGTGTVIRQSSIVALKFSDFENVYLAENTDPIEIATTSTTFTPVTGLNIFNVVNPSNYHLVIGCMFMKVSSTTASGYAKLSNLSRNLDFNIAHVREANANTEFYPTVVARITSFASSTPEIGWQFASETTGVTTSAIYNNIAIIDLGIPAPPIAYVGSTSVVNNTSLALSDLVEPGDLVIVASHSTSTAPALPSTYTNGETGSTNTVNYRWSYKFMSDPVDTTVTGLTAGADMKHIAMVFRDINSTTPFDVTPLSASGATGAPNPPARTVNDINAIVMVVIGFLDDDNVAIDVTPPDGYTTIIAEEATGTIMAAYKRIPQGTGTNINEDPTVFGIGAGDDAWVAVTIPLRQV